MASWNLAEMQQQGERLFHTIYRRKNDANPNHETHYLSRELKLWLTDGIKRLQDGTYSPRHTKRFYFKDEMVEQLHVTDRVLQNLLLKQLKPTFKHIINPNCLHIHGPSGVKLATQRVEQALESGQYHYFIRADIKSYYKSIQHRYLIDDIKEAFNDKNVIHMLSEIIRNPIDTPWGTRNPDNGLPLRGPLSQFLSALYLKPLDDAFNHSDVEYIRYQDDILLLCKTKRQFNRCRQKICKVLKNRRLLLSRKKSKLGAISQNFHFLGVHYLGTQPLDNTNSQALAGVQNKTMGGGRQL